jgi:adenine-specific DNA-methyltransferase
MPQLKMHTPNLTENNIGRIAELFPNCVTEARDEATGEIKKAIDFDQLRRELSDHVVDGPRERYHLNWPGKREAMLAANAPIAKTFRPCREESVDFDTTKNLFIEGDNLDALKLLQETYLNRIKMIYIDPPYNTGREFIYDDDFAEDAASYLLRSGQATEEGNRLVANTDANGRYHSDWLSMMYPRLRLARSLLRDDGVLFISIDDHEMASLRRLCDEVFGEGNFVATIIWQKVYAPKNTAQWFSEDHDYILVYARDKAAWKPQPLPRTEAMEARYSNPDNDPRGPWKAENFTARNRYDAGVYSITCPSGRLIAGPPRGRYWVYDEKKFKELVADKRIWWGEDGNNSPSVKRFLSEVSAGRTPQTLWSYEEVGHTQDAKKTLLKYVPFQHTENVLNSVKPAELIQRMLQLAGSRDEDAIVLDFFCGSATTAHAVLKQNAEDGGNRRFIGVQIAEPLPIPERNLASIFQMGTTRVRNVIEELRSDAAGTLAGQAATPALGFRVLKIDSSNMKDVYYTPDAVTQETLTGLIDNVKDDRSDEDLLFQVLLDWGVDLTLPITPEKIGGKIVYFVDTNALAACFEPGIDEAFIKELAKRKPLRAVFRDTGYGSDATKINVEQIFRLLSPTTEVKTL